MAKTHESLLNPRQLEAIVAVARAGSVHAAARQLRIPQPALSRLVATAEKMLGTSLFDRSRAGTQPTQDGERVVKQAEFALHALERVAEAAREPLPVVRLGCIPRVMHVLIPHLLAQLAGGTAGFRLHVSVGTSNELAIDLEASKVDFVIARRAGAEIPEVGRIDAEKLYNERTVIVCGRSNKLFSDAVCELADLVQLPWVLPKRGFHSRHMLDGLLSSRGLPPIVPVIETNSFESSLSVVAATKFLAMAPEFAARRFERLHLVRILQMRPAFVASPVMLQYNHRQRAHPAFEPFRIAALAAARKIHTS
ncbi:MAG: LysR family transcriptional regulator [Casimicrobiaceae bacterium]